MSHVLLVGNALEQLHTLPSESVDCIVTSPPYWGLRDYGVSGQIGLEPTLQEFLSNLGEVFAECHRVLKPTGNLWVNMGDSYATNAGNANRAGGGTQGKEFKGPNTQPNRLKAAHGLAPKNLIGQPWRLAFALQDAGWILRRDIIWHKPSPMPESVKDRCTTAHEYIFHFVKSGRYYYNGDAIREPAKESSMARLSQDVENQEGSSRANAGGKTNGKMKAVARTPQGWAQSDKYADRDPRYPKRDLGDPKIHAGSAEGIEDRKHVYLTANARSVWTFPTAGYSGAHFATFPEELPRRCILAGCPEGGTVLDPFAGSGTTLAVAKKLGRKSIGIDLNPDYAQIIRERMDGITESLFLEDAS